MKVSRPPAGMTRLVLVRHTEPEASVQGRVHGWHDVEISAEGHLHAAGIAAGLAGAPMTAIYSSPLKRALDTAIPIADAHRLGLVTCERLKEIHFGLFEGLTYAEAEARFPDVFAMWMERPFEVTFPGGENYTVFRARVLGAANAIADARRGQAVGIIAHAGVTRLLIAEAAGFDLHESIQIAQPYGSVTVIDSGCSCPGVEGDIARWYRAEAGSIPAGGSGRKWRRQRQFAR